MKQGEARWHQDLRWDIGDAVVMIYHEELISAIVTKIDWDDPELPYLVKTVSYHPVINAIRHGRWVTPADLIDAECEIPL